MYLSISSNFLKIIILSINCTFPLLPFVVIIYYITMNELLKYVLIFVNSINVCFFFLYGQEKSSGILPWQESLPVSWFPVLRQERLELFISDSYGYFILGYMYVYLLFIMLSTSSTSLLRLLCRCIL